jgi:hypothetical protein
METIILLVSGLGIFVTAIILLIENFKKNVAWGIASLFCGIPLFVFGIMHFKEVKKTFLLHVAFYILAFAGAIYPAFAEAKARAQRIACVNNLKQIGIATRIYATDNQDRFPWQVPQAEGGTAEIAQPQSDTDALLNSDGKPIFDVNAWRHFQALSNELSNPKVVRCPRDGSRTQANTFQSTPPKGAGRNVIPFDKNSVSYWLRSDPEVDEAQRNEVMVVCPHHDGHYNILLTDSSVQQASWSRLAQYFKDITNPITIAPK